MKKLLFAMILGFAIFCFFIEYGVAQSAQEAAGASEDVRLVDAWLNMAGQFNDRLLATVYWALGVVGASLFALVGYNWFVTFRAYERDKSALMDELRNQIKSDSIAYQLEISNQMESFKGAVRKDIKRIISDEIENVRANIKSLEDEVKEKFVWVELTQGQHESKIWESKGVASNVVACEIARAKLAHENNIDWVLNDALSRIEQFIPRIVKDAGRETELSDLLDSLPSKYATIKARLQKHFQ